MRMKIIRPLLIFFTLLSMAITLFAQTVSESNANTKTNAEVKLNIEDNAHPIEIFPNPTSDYVHINLKEAGLRDVSFELYDIIGNKVDVEAQEMKEDIYRIPVEKLHMGYYVLIITDSYSRYKKAFKFSKR